VAKVFASFFKKKAFLPSIFRRNGTLALRGSARGRGEGFSKRRRSGGICIPPDLPPITERDGSAWHPSRAGLVGGPKLGFLDTALLAIGAELHVVLEAGAFLGEKARYLTVGKIIRQVVAAG
jgi:hypothetical protein